MESQNVVDDIASPQKRNILPADSHLTLRQSFVSPDREGEISAGVPDYFKSTIADHLVSLDFDNLDFALSNFYGANECRDEDEHLELMTGIYSYIIDRLMIAYDRNQMVSARYLQEMIHKLIIFTLQRGIGYTPARLTEFILFAAKMLPDAAQDVLDCIPVENRTEQMHAISYNLEWNSASNETLEAEACIQTMCLELEDPYLEEEVEKLCNPVAYQKRQNTIEEEVTIERAKLLPDQLKEKHWLTLRVRFEYLWRHMIESKSIKFSGQRTYPPAVQQSALKLLKAILVLSKHFDKFEYGWYWAERSFLLPNWSIELFLLEFCRLNASKPDGKVWLARAWVLYKQVKEMDANFKNGNYNFVLFITRFARVIKEADSKECLNSLPKIYEDTLYFCNEHFFPVPDRALEPLIESCWEHRLEPKDVWSRAIEIVFKVYDYYKACRYRPTSIFKEYEYFEPYVAALLMNICMSNGSINEYKLLNEDIMLSSSIDVDYVNEVKRGYFLTTIGKKPEETPAPIEKVTPPKISEQYLECLRVNITSCL